MTNSEMDQITAIQVKYIDELMAKKHVVGVAVGLAMKDGAYTDKVGIVVMVEKKVPLEDLDENDRIPEQLDGVVVDVQETGSFTAQ